MKLLILLSLTIFCFNFAKAQENSGIMIGVGTGALKSVYPVLRLSLDHATVIEPSIGYYFADSEAALQLSINYTKGSHDDVLAADILNYKVRGWGYKVGVNVWPLSNEFLHTGLYLTFAHYQETGTFLFEGNYFDNYEAIVTSYNWALGGEFQVGLKIPFSIGNFLVYTRFNGYGGNNNKKFSTQYIPSTGYSLGKYFSMGVEAKLNVIIPTN